MKRLEEFRIYYNHTIHPELVRLERKRRRLLWFMLLSVFVLAGLLLLELFIDVFFLSLLMLIPIGLYIIFLGYRIRQFIADFKPRVIRLILDFIEVGQFEYKSNGVIPKADFLKSRIFATSAPSYQGEDHISGKIGEVEFAMSEVNVKEFSKVRSRLNYVFRGVFLNAHFDNKFRGAIYILPEKYKQYLTRSIKQFTRQGAIPVEADEDFFEKVFMIYATPDAPVYSLLSREVQVMLVNYHFRTGKEIYISFIGGEMYIAVTEPKDLLEPYLFRSNVSFDLVREFYEDIYLLFSIVEDFDHHH